MRYRRGSYTMKKKICKILCNIALIVLILCFLAGLLWLIMGSLEMEPTAEQIEKARIGALCIMSVSGMGLWGTVLLRRRV